MGSAATIDGATLLVSELEAAVVAICVLIDVAGTIIGLSLLFLWPWRVL